MNHGWEPKSTTANPLMDRTVVGALFVGMAALVALVTSPTTAASNVVKSNCTVVASARNCNVM